MTFEPFWFKLRRHCQTLQGKGIDPMVPFEVGIAVWVVVLVLYIRETIRAEWHR